MDTQVNTDKLIVKLPQKVPEFVAFFAVILFFSVYLLVATTISLIAALILIGKDVYALVMMIKKSCENKK